LHNNNKNTHSQSCLFLILTSSDFELSINFSLLMVYIVYAYHHISNFIFLYSFQKAFQCNYADCTKSYTSNTHLQRHITTSHDTVSPEYKKSFKYVYIILLFSVFSWDYKEKIKWIFDVLRCTYPGCGVSIRHESNLRRHYMRAHEPRQFKHQCKHCPQSFCKQQQLITHELQHTTEAALR
jgi:hypothetical protein